MSDPDILMIAIKQNPNIFMEFIIKYRFNHLLYNIEIICQVVKTDSSILCYVSKTLLDNKKVILSAIQRTAISNK
jgi:hypothetical protein